MATTTTLTIIKQYHNKFVYTMHYTLNVSFILQQTNQLRKTI